MAKQGVKPSGNGTVNVNAITDEQLARVKRMIASMAAQKNPNATLVVDMTSGKDDANYRRIVAAFYSFCYEFMVYVNMAVDGRAPIEETEQLVGKMRQAANKQP